MAEACLDQLRWCLVVGVLPLPPWEVIIMASDEVLAVSEVPLSLWYTAVRLPRCWSLWGGVARERARFCSEIKAQML
jgi:hypothetical protein